MSTEIPVSLLTEASLTGTGVFDVLMKATKAHLDEEYTKNRIRGTEYSQVYLGSLTQILQTATQFLLENRKAALEAELLQAQIDLAVVQKNKALAELALVEAQTAHTVQETANLVTAELIARVQRDLVSQQVTNAITENDNMIKQGCKLQAEYDVLMEQKLKTIAEAALLAQKNMTEKAQTVALGVDDNSVIGKQKKLYEAQTQGFSRDAEQKAAKLLIDSWNVRRTTDEGTVADATNMLNDATVGRAVSKMLQGVGA